MAEKQDASFDKLHRAGIRLFGYENSRQQILQMIEERDQLLLPFLEALDHDEQDHAQEWARQIYEQGGRLSPITVITPIAAHQESAETVFNTLSQYAAQKEATPFSIVLGLNTPTAERDNPNIAKILGAIESAEDTFASLDVRVVHEAYDEPVIGRVRRDLWNAVAWQSYDQTADGHLTETIGVSHDIDIKRLSPHYIHAIQAHYQRVIAREAQYGPFWSDIELPALWTPGKHEYDPRTPNLSRAVMYVDMLNRMTRDGYEAGSVYPISFYANQGGINPDARTHEIGSLLKGRGRPTYLASDPTGRWAVSSATSMRRFAYRLHTNSLREVWTPDSFGPNDACRVTTPTDITADRLNELVVESLPTDMMYNVYGGEEFSSPIYSLRDYEKEARRLYRTAIRHQRLADRALRSIVGMPFLADSVTERYKDMPALVRDNAITVGKIHHAIDFDINPPSSTLRRPPVASNTPES